MYLILPDEQRLRKRIEQLQQYRLNGIRTLADGELFEAEKRKRDAMLGGKKGALDAPASAGGKTAGKKRGAGDAAVDEERLAKARKEAGGKSASAAAASSNPDWDTTKMPGHELLSSQERVLCSTLQLLPQHYLMIKERLIREVSSGRTRRDRLLQHSPPFSFAPAHSVHAICVIVRALSSSASLAAS